MFINVNNVDLFYEKSGSGPGLVLLHGNSEDHHVFDRLVAKLANHFTIYALDSRDHGQSQMTGAYSYEAMAEDLSGFIEALKLAPVNIVGFSDGAIQGLLLALNKPQAVKKLALLGGNLSPDDFTEEAVAYLREVEKDLSSPVFSMIFTEPHIELETLKNIKAPCLVVYGENDLFKPELPQAIAQTIPKASLLVLKGHDHLSYIVDNDLMYEDLWDFFMGA
ncbi:MAG: alpha/beta hydrolase [Deltaproteobacteria bacterium]|jgi:pimeloyl-ACP methyl ester carboxylesterase|nr:alpha/beta hydrolase [Deltaproteobacteria bacterium]